jgi:hypothetical protein
MDRMIIEWRRAGQIAISIPRTATHVPDLLAAAVDPFGATIVRPWRARCLAATRVVAR